MNFEKELVRLVRSRGSDEAQRQLDEAMGTVNAMLRVWNDPDTFVFQLLKGTLLELEKCQRVLQQIRFQEHH